MTTEDTLKATRLALELIVAKDPDEAELLARRLAVVSDAADAQSDTPIDLMVGVQAALLDAVAVARGERL